MYKYMWQSQVENEHYSYHFLSTFNTLHGCISIPAPPRMLKLAMVDSCPIHIANIGPYLPSIVVKELLEWCQL